MTSAHSIALEVLHDVARALGTEPKGEVRFYRRWPYAPASSCFEQNGVVHVRTDAPAHQLLRCVLRLHTPKEFMLPITSQAMWDSILTNAAAPSPAWAAMCRTVSRPLFGAALPDPFDYANWPVEAPGSDPYLARLEDALHKED